MLIFPSIWGYPEQPEAKSLSQEATIKQIHNPKPFPQGPAELDSGASLFEVGVEGSVLAP